MADGSREYSGSYVNGFYRCRIVAEWTNVTEAGFTLTTKTYVDVADYYHDNGDNFDGWAKVGSSSTAWTTGADTYLTGPTSLLLATKSQYVTRTHTGFNTAVSGGVRNTYNSYYAGPSEASGSVYCSPKSSYTVSYNANNGNSTPNSQTKWALESPTLAGAISRNNSTGTAWTVNFNANGGSSTGASNNKLSASRTTSYTFAGWNTNSSGTGTNYAAGASYTTDAALSLYAKWTSSTSTGQVTLPTPTRSGYTFAGWYTASSGGTRRGGAGDKWTPTADGVTLYAQWTQNTWTVAYNANGGNSSSVPASQTKTADVALTLSSTTPTRNTAGNGQYSITYNYNGGSGTPTSASAARTISYAFRRWNTSANGSGTSYNPGGSYTANAGATLYAQWSSTPHTASVTLPTPSARTGYDFGGWYNGSTKVGNAGATWTPTGSTDSITLTAKWTLKTYPITLNAQGGNVTTTALTKEYGNALSLPTPTSSGFRFVGWNTVAAGTGTNYTSSLPTTFNQSATLYAQWIKASLSTISAFRIVTDPGDDDSEEPDRMGTRGKVTGSWVVDSTMATSTTVTVEYKLVTATNWTLVATSTASSAKSGTVSQVITGPLDVGEAYQVRVTLTTVYFTNQTYPAIVRVTTISKAFALLTGLAGGTGLAIGAIATLANTFEVALASIFNGIVDVMQGNLTRSGTNTTASNGDHPIRFIDAAKSVMSYITAHKTNDSPRNFLRMTAISPNGTNTANLYVSAGDDDKQLTTDCEWRTQITANTTAIVVKDTRFDRDGTNPSDTVWSAVHGFQDADGENLGYLQAYQTPAGYTGLNLYVVSEDANGNTFANYIRLSVNKSGTKSYTVSDAAAFRTAIGAPHDSLSRTTTVSDVITAASGRTIGSVTYAEWGKVAQLSVACTGFSASTGSQAVGTVVSGKRPTYAVYATAVTSSYVSYAQLAADGALTVYWASAPSTSGSYTVRFVYLLA